MSGTLRHGRNAAIFIDCSAAGTFAPGTVNLTQLNGKNTWSFDQTADRVDVTAFGDSSKTTVAGLPNAEGDVSGAWDSSGSGTLVYNIIGASTERAVQIYPDYTNNKTSYISGYAFFDVKSGGGVTSAVSLDIHFTAGPSGMTWTHP